MICHSTGMCSVACWKISLEKSIERLQLASELSLSHYGKPLVCEYSGGKDSDVQLRLFEMSGIPFEVHNSHTTVDAPPTVYHIRDVFKRLDADGIKCNIDYHTKENGTRVTMWNLIPRKLVPPTRLIRYCCSELKEGGNANRMFATGVRWAESRKRSQRSTFEVLAPSQKDSIGVSDEKMLITDNDDTRRLFESCQLKAKTVVNPIIDWNDENIWDFINDEKINVCEMYYWGYERLGCIGCPLARKRQREREFYDFPKYKQAYIRAFDKMLEMRAIKGKATKWTCGEEVFLWWMQSSDIPGQMNLIDFGI
jgi:phosphoadenosine phosphosulfate reductase